MRLLIYGGFGVASIENSFVDVWKNCGGVGDVSIIDRLKVIRPASLATRIWRRIAFTLNNDVRHLNAQLLYFVKFKCPDVVIIFKGLELHPKTLKEIKKTGVLLVCYNPDDPYIFSGRGSGNRWMTKSMKLYDLYLTYSAEAMKLLQQDGIKSAIIPFGYEADAIEEPFVSPSEEVVRACFVGNPDAERVRFIREFSKAVPVDVYGHGWRKLVKETPYLKCYDAVYGAKHWTILARYRVQINLMRRHNHGSHNMRTFSAPACGAIVLAPDNSEHRFYFQEGREIFLYSSVESARQEAKRLLSLSYEASTEIRMAARTRCIVSGYSYVARAHEFLEKVKQVQDRSIRDRI